MDVAVWLRSLGLEQYEAAFRENAITEKILLRLTAEDLKDLGVGLVGHRRALLDAIATLRADPDAQSALPSSTLMPTTPVPVPLASAPEAVGERRHITVMFCDLVGSTGISAALDAEDWRDLVGTYVDAASAAITEMGGHVAQKLGDGLMALFGYPVAQENDVERAARAALSIHRSLADVNRKNEGSGKPELLARIGLETGPAVLDATGQIYGDVANIAARVQALAEPGTVLVTARVQHQAAGLFVVEERGTHALKGVPEPTVLFRLVRASGGGRARSGQRQFTPLVGRDEEIALLLRRWERARQGEGQLVLIVGEPGIGKSRLIDEFHARMRDTPHTWVEWNCSQLLQNTPLHPIAVWGDQRFGGADIPAERRLAELESSLAQVKLDPAENAPLLAPLLDILLPAGRAPALAPEELRRRQLAALTNWVMAGARSQPVVLALEDLHWADPTTLDVLRGIAERGALAPLFVLMTTRPEIRPSWGTRSHHCTVSLVPLDHAQVRHMIEELAARHALSSDVVDHVAARTGGVPLFVEEVTRLLMERGERGGTQAIPPTLQQSLMARLDRLGPAREVAQIGSVIGRGFSYALLRALAGMADSPLQAALKKIAEADILLVQGLPPDSDYRFKHTLIQDAAYENLLKSRRQVMHRHVAEILRDRFADTAAAEPEVLAHHFTQAGMTDEAIEWWGKAGDQALHRSAFQEAIFHLSKAIEMADKEGDRARTAKGFLPTPKFAEIEEAQALSETDEVKKVVAARQRRLKLQVSLANALLQSRGQHSSETKLAFDKARELASGIDDPLQRFSTYYGVWVGGYVRGERATMIEAAEALMKEADARPGPDSAEKSIANRIYGVTCWMARDDLTTARTCLEKAVAFYRPERDRELAHRFAQDIGVSARAYLSLVLFVLGESDQARAVMADAMSLAAETKHAPTLIYAYYHAAFLEMLRLDPVRAKCAAETCLALAREHGVETWTLLAPPIVAWANADWDEMRRSLADCRERDIWLAAGTGRSLLAAGQAAAGQLGSALATADEAIAEAEQRGLRFFEAETHHIRGEILLKRDPANTAPVEEAFLSSIAIAQQQRVRSFELRAALSLAKLYQSTRRAADAHAILAPVLAGFSPTPEFPEIAEARELLATL